MRDLAPIRTAPTQSLSIGCVQARVARPQKCGPLQALCALNCLNQRWGNTGGPGDLPCELEVAHVFIGRNVIGDARRAESKNSRERVDDLSQRYGAKKGIVKSLARFASAPGRRPSGEDGQTEMHNFGQTRGHSPRSANHRFGRSFVLPVYAARVGCVVGRPVRSRAIENLIRRQKDAARAMGCILTEDIDATAEIDRLACCGIGLAAPQIGHRQTNCGGAGGRQIDCPSIALRQIHAPSRAGPTGCRHHIDTLRACARYQRTADQRIAAYDRKWRRELRLKRRRTPPKTPTRPWSCRMVHPKRYNWRTCRCAPSRRLGAKRDVRS